MSRITRSIMAALAALAFAAPVATAMPARDAALTSSLAGTTSSSPQQDRRGEFSVTPQTGAVAPVKDLRSADARDAGAKAIVPVAALHGWPVDPDPIAPAPVEAVPVAGGDGTSPLVYVLPGALLSLLLAAGMGYAVRTSGRARRARIGV